MISLRTLLVPLALASLAGAGTARAESPADAASVDLVAAPAGAGPAESAAESAAAPGPGVPASTDVSIRRLADSLAAGFFKLPGARYQRLAVLDFAEVGGEAQRRQLGKVVAAELATDLRRDYDFFLVERSRLGALLGEIRLAAMGAVDASQAAQLGKLADAQALVLGTVSEAGDRYLVTARIVATETGETLAVASESISAASLVALSSDAVVLRSRRDALFRSLVVPGWGQLYNRQPAKGWAFAGAQAALVAGAIAFQLRGTAAEQDYHRKVSAGDLGSDPGATAARLRRRAEQAYRTRNTLLLAAAGVWAANAVDAWFSGVDGERLVAVVPLEGGGGLVVAGRF